VRFGCWRSRSEASSRPYRGAEDGGVKRLEDDVREGQGLGHCEYAYFVPGFAARDSHIGQSFFELSSFKRVSNPYREVNLCALP